MRTHTRSRQLLDHIPPPGAALQRKLTITIGAMLGQPAPQRLACRRPDLNHPGFCGDSEPTKGWSHASTEEVSG